MCLPSPLDLYLLCNWSPCLYCSSSTSTAFIFYFGGGDDDYVDLHVTLMLWPADGDDMRMIENMYTSLPWGQTSAEGLFAFAIGSFFALQ